MAEKVTWDIWKVQWKPSYVTIWFAGNGLAPTTNKHCDFIATLMCGGTSGNFTGLAGIVNAIVDKTANICRSRVWQIVLIFITAIESYSITGGRETIKMLICMAYSTHYSDIAWKLWSIKSPAVRLFFHQFVGLTTKKTQQLSVLRVLCHWNLWIPLTNGQWCGKRFYVMASP